MEAEELEKISSDYLKGFNEGYLLTEQIPDLAAQIAKAINASDRGQGFKDGREQLLLEKTKEKLLDKGKQTIEVEPDKSVDKELDI